MIIHPAHSRGRADHGWLKSFHTFSFAEYYNPERVHFGALRVINDDSIAAGTGFGRHPHRDMEIITIPLKGSVIHEDSEGNKGVIGRGEVQVMSAGTGIFHSEFADPDLTTELFQIWVFPKQKNVKPRYDQRAYPLEERKDRFQLVVSPDGRENSLFIHQDAFFSLIEMTDNKEAVYTPHIKTNGAYLLVISGECEIDGQTLNTRDGIGIEHFQIITLKSKAGCEILIMEVPMSH